MTKLIALGAAAADNGLVQFNRTELTLLLNLYARRAAEGQWRDYAIDHGPACAVFSLYRHSLEQPVLTISKRAERIYVVSQGGRELARCGALTDALAVLERMPVRIPPP